MDTLTSSRRNLKRKSVNRTYRTLICGVAEKGEKPKFVVVSQWRRTQTLTKFNHVASDRRRERVGPPPAAGHRCGQGSFPSLSSHRPVLSTVATVRWRRRRRRLPSPSLAAGVDTVRPPLGRPEPPTQPPPSARAVPFMPNCEKNAFFLCNLSTTTHNFFSFLIFSTRLHSLERRKEPKCPSTWTRWMQRFRGNLFSSKPQPR